MFWVQHCPNTVQHQGNALTTRFLKRIYKKTAFVVTIPCYRTRRISPLWQYKCETRNTFNIFCDLMTVFMVFLWIFHVNGFRVNWLYWMVSPQWKTQEVLLASFRIQWHYSPNLIYIMKAAVRSLEFDIFL